MLVARQSKQTYYNEILLYLQEMSMACNIQLFLTCLYNNVMAYNFSEWDNIAVNGGVFCTCGLGLSDG